MRKPSRHVSWVIALLAAFSAIVSSNAIQAHTSVAAPTDDFERVRAALDWYVTSIESYRLTYRTQLRWTKKGWELEQKAMAEAEGHVGSEIPVMPPPYERYYELTKAGEMLRVKSADYNDGMMGDYEILVYDGRNTYRVRHHASGEVENMITAQGPERTTPLVDSPVVYAGLDGFDRWLRPHRGLNGIIHSSTRPVITASKLGASVVYKLESTPMPLSPDAQAFLRTYLDPTHDYLPLKTELCDQQTARPINSNTVLEFKSVVDGKTGRTRWFPVRGMFEDFVHDTLISTIETNVENLSINPTVAIEEFRVDVPDGVPVIDNLTHRARLLGSDATREQVAQRLAEESKIRLREAIEKASQRKPITVQRPNSGAIVPLSLAFVSALFIALAVWLNRRSQ